MAFLYRVQPDGSLSQHWMLGGDCVVVGRGEFADAFVDDEALSRSHFLIVCEGKDYFAVDLDSQNGTWVKGKRISGCRLQSGDLVKAGQSFFFFSREPITAAALPGTVPLPGASAVPLRAQAGVP
jgi:pSer/pThr/pTyr-binding forkhead associated (FHA) protein